MPPSPPRIRRTSDLSPRPASTGRPASPLSRVVSESLADDSGFSVFGIANAVKEQSLKRHSGISTPPMGSPSTWWGGREQPDEHRPWRDPPRRKNTIPEAQTEGWIHTRERVGQAAASVLGTTADVAHEVLITSISLLEFVPVPGLAPAARVLLEIWDALQLVDTNRLQCLRLTERCADILLSVREEVKEAGDQVDEELQAPIAKLTESFHVVQSFLIKQVHRPFLKRYLKRDEIQGSIRACHAGLTEALVMLGLSIQIRILRSVKEAERGRRAEQRALIGLLSHAREGEKTEGLGLSGMGKSESALTVKPAMGKSESALTLKPGTTETPMLTPTPMIAVAFPSPSASPTSSPLLLSPPQPTLTPPSPSPSPPDPPTTLLPALQTLQTNQDAHDRAQDTEDLRALIRAALRAGSDAEIFKLLQIGREEMPEAVKTLQRALERVGAGTGARAGAGTGKKEKKRWGMGLGRTRGSLSLSPPPPPSGSSASQGTDARRTSVNGTDAGADAATDTWGTTTDALDREFIESGIDALRRMSRGAGITTSSLPPWTITRYEVDREQKIGVGFFSDVYRGTWRGRTVAIKVLAPTTPRALFVREVQVWRGLRHQGVLQLFGASSACGERPWFFVCAYMRRGSLVEFLKRVEMGLEGAGASGRVVFPIWEEGHAGKQQGEGVTQREGDLYRFMLEIAQGMEYLHENGVLHGDLKAANVLVDDNVRCVISDFGQSEMKSEAYRISGTVPPRGTLRWQAPELMSGESQLALTPQMDVYAYAISCVEIVAMGKLPWPLADDEAVRHFVLRENTRPALPFSRFNTPQLQDLLRVCWHHDPSVRPPFAAIVRDVEALRRTFFSDGNGEESPAPLSSPIAIDRSRHAWEWEWGEHVRTRPSPDMRPLPLPQGTPPAADGVLTTGHGASPDSSYGTFVTAEETLSPASPSKVGVHVHHSRREDVVSPDHVRMSMPVPAVHTHSGTSDSSVASSLFTHTPSSTSLDELGLTTPGRPVSVAEAYESPTMQDETIKLMRNERRYRLLLSHQFHPSLTLPLWEPSQVKLGAVGYLLKPEGRFITLFNSFSPEKSQDSAVHGLPSLFGYGKVSMGSQRQDRRNAAQRGYDAVVGLLTSKGRSGSMSSSFSRRYSFQLRAGHKTAHMFTESTMYRYMERLEVPKRWFNANVDAIMQIYGPMHHIQKEDLFLVIGTLDAQEHALFVSHDHPDGQAHFNVFSAPRNGEPWGTFTTDTEVPPEMGGPSYDEPIPGHAISSNKVSRIGVSWETVLVARLRFRPDALEPTSL